MTPEETARLEAWLAEAAGASAVRVTGSAKLGGGAIQDNRRLDLEAADGPFAGAHALVLRLSSPGAVPASHDRAGEFALLRAAWDAGVTVPEPLFLCPDAGVLGRPFFVMRRVAGVALGPKVVKDRSLGGDRDALARRLAAELARIHAIRPGGARGLGFLGGPPADPARHLVRLYRGWADALGARRPVLEWALRWLERRAPAPTPAPDGAVLCHRDFRTGNYLVDADGLTAILDWEFAGWGDPLEDVGWMCSRFWRFGADHLEAGGIAPRATFVDAYREASGRWVAPEAVSYWEVMANLRWALIALQQCRRFTSGAEASLELALIGRRVPEMELEIVELTEARP